MTDVSIMDLRKHVRDVVDRVVAGELVTVTRHGRAIAELRPVDRSPLTAHILVERWRRLPAMDADAFRRDVDAVIDQSL